MCRYNSGFFYKQQVLEPFDFYWRVEPGIQLFCDVDYDPFLFVRSSVSLQKLQLTSKPPDASEQQEYVPNTDIVSIGLSFAAR